METALVLGKTTQCQKVVIDFTRGAVKISRPVGELRGRSGNLPDDVMVIQQAINNIPVALGGRKGGILLAVDGKCGDKTTSAISQYQMKRFRVADGRVDPDGRTSRQMNTDLGPNDAPDEELVKTIIGLVPRAMVLIKGAQVKLTFAEPAFRGIGGGLLNGLQEEARALVNRHFSLDGFPDWAPEFARIKQVFATMELVIARGFNGSLGQWQGVFAPNGAKSMDTTHAYTYAGGWRKADSSNVLPFPQRVDRIYICRGLAKECSDYQAMAIVHELAHFVGGDQNSSNMIDDHAYGWVDAPKMTRLLPWWKTRNAQSFANFAFESALGTRVPGL